MKHYVRSLSQFVSRRKARQTELYAAIPVRVSPCLPGSSARLSSQTAFFQSPERKGKENGCDFIYAASAKLDSPVIFCPPFNVSAEHGTRFKDQITPSKPISPPINLRDFRDCLTIIYFPGSQTGSGIPSTKLAYLARTNNKSDNRFK